MKVSIETRRRIELLFPKEQQKDVEMLLATRCGNNLPSLELKTEIELERFQFAALKVSAGDFDKLIKAVGLANVDWRDLLVISGFAEDANAHRSWLVSSQEM